MNMNVALEDCASVRVCSEHSYAEALPEFLPPANDKELFFCAFSRGLLKDASILK